MIKYEQGDKPEVDRGFLEKLKNMSSSDIMDRLSRVGYINPSTEKIEKYSPAVQRAINAGTVNIIKKGKRNSSLSSYKPKIKETPLEIFDIQEAFEGTEFIDKFEKNYDSAINLYKDLITKTLAYMSAMRNMERELHEQDDFKSFTVDIDVLKKVLKAHSIDILCKHLEVDPVEHGIVRRRITQ